MSEQQSRPSGPDAILAYAGPPLTRYGRIVRLEGELHEAQAAYLRHHGWEWTSCAFPDHFWRWVRDFPEGRMTVCTEEAVRITQYVLDKEAPDYD